MNGTLRERLEALGEAFWLRPGMLVLAGVLLGEGVVRAEGTEWLRSILPEGWIYAGGEAGARSLLSAVAASTIGVAGTVFSITVAALTLASGQMGPRLLRNFVRDGGNQAALGIFLGTFAYALVVLRTVRSTEEGAFVPHLGVTGALLLALVCVAMLVWFVHHVASGINVETVIALVHNDLCAALARLSLDRPDPPAPPPPTGGQVVALPEGGYLRALDEAALADWAAEAGVAVVLHVRPGDHVFRGVPVAQVVPDAGGDAVERVREALTLGPRQAAAQDLEFAVRQLVEVGVRALSSGINDPFTAMAVLDHLGDALCRLCGRHLAGAAVLRDGRAVLFRRVTDYDGLLDAMFHLVRQSGTGSAAVLIHLLDVLAAVLTAEDNPGRRAALLRHANLALAAGREGLRDRAALAALEARHAALPGGSGPLPSPS
ncbi:DUF2254 domain-containing protein [Muricoccus pecuniae]|uniref:Putative membrane protein n=1 Tax=Muricoccus pecuniae TaxID=693023 RepID=A0A840Y6I2_9PROT|nr:DUF2254 domain-containing protein [Roseomonas pecuniae]MBB5696345.1 putative membrane protein [Roseomonas pecuniae]